MIGTFTGTGTSNPFDIAAYTSKARGRVFNFALWGTFVADAQLEKSFDGEVWHPITANGTELFRFTAPCCEMAEEFEVGVQYHWNCTAYTSGVVNYRISQCLV